MEPKTTKKPSRKLVVFKRELPFYLMLIPGVTFLIIFSYLPMFGLVMAFQDFTPLRSFKNSPWVGLKNFRDMLALPTFWNVVGNTLSISIAKIILRLLVPLILALLLNEVVRPKFMRMAQTVFFLPYFLSWAVMGGVLRNPAPDRRQAREQKNLCRSIFEKRQARRGFHCRAAQRAGRYLHPGG